MSSMACQSSEGQGTMTASPTALSFRGNHNYIKTF